jgi:hypothetical protein
MPYVHFQVVREDWGHYKLPNGLEIRARLVLLRLFDDGEGPIKVTTTPQIDVWTPADLVGTPAPPGAPAAASSIKETHIKWETLQPAFSHYEIPSHGTLLLNYVPTKMLVHEVVNHLGEPVITIESSQEIVAMPSKLSEAMKA